MTCPYKTYRYRRGCTITVAHLHWPRWATSYDPASVCMRLAWWPASRERRAA